MHSPLLGRVTDISAVDYQRQSLGFVNAAEKQDIAVRQSEDLVKVKSRLTEVERRTELPQPQLSISLILPLTNITTKQFPLLSPVVNRVMIFLIIVMHAYQQHIQTRI